MITDFRIQNLRSIKDSGEIKLKPIMILLGVNSSGKSTFLRSFPLFTQSVDKKLRGPIAWFDNSFVDFGDFKTAKNRYAEESEGISFYYRFNNISNPVRYLRFYNNIESLDNDDLKEGTVVFTLQEDGKGAYIKTFAINLVNAQYHLEIDDRNDYVHFLNSDIENELSERFKFNFNTNFGILPTIVPNKISEDTNTFASFIAEKLINIFKRHCNKRLRNVERLYYILDYRKLDKQGFLNRMKQGSGLISFQKSIQNWTTNTQEFNYIYNLFVLMKLNSIIEIVNTEIASFYHGCDYIAPMRAEADRYYRIQGLQVNAVDSDGHNLLEFIASLSAKEKTSYDSFIKDVLGVTVDVPAESGMKSLRIKTDDGDFSIADVGYGYSQVLPVITKLWHTTYIHTESINSVNRFRYRELRKATLLMEQPELHLHPAMQAKVADTFIKAIEETRKANAAITLIVETHSQAIVNRIGRRIYEGKISPEDVSVLLFNKDSQNRNTIIRQIEYTDEGRLKDWPLGFFDPID